MIRPRPLGRPFGASSSVYHPSQASPASIRPDLRDTPTHGHKDTDTPTCLSMPASASRHLSPASPQPPVLLHKLLPPGMLGLQMHGMPGPTTSSTVPPGPTHGGLTLEDCLSQHCLSWHGDLEPPHCAEYGQSALPNTHMLTHVTLGQSLSLSGPRFRHL